MIGARTISVAAITGIAALGLPGHEARAADNCTGDDSHYSLSLDTTDLGKGVTISATKDSSLITSTNSVYKMVSGVCAGTSVTTSDKKAYAMGYCARHDADGDAQTIMWHMAPGAEKGEWKSIDGTGKYSGKKDSGWFQGVYGDGKISMVLWGGTCH